MEEISIYENNFQDQIQQFNSPLKVINENHIYIEMNHRTIEASETIREAMIMFMWHQPICSLHTKIYMSSHSKKGVSEQMRMSVNFFNTLPIQPKYIFSFKKNCI